METVQETVGPSTLRQAFLVSRWAPAAIVLAVFIAGSIYLPALLVTYAAYYLGALLAAALLLALAPKIWKASSETRQKRVRRAFRMQAGLGAFVALVALAFVACPIEFRSGILFKVLVVAIPTLALAGPAGFVVTAYLLKGQSEAARFRENRSVISARLLIAASWAGAVFLVGLTNWIQISFE